MVKITKAGGQLMLHLLEDHYEHEAVETQFEESELQLYKATTPITVNP